MNVRTGTEQKDTAVSFASPLPEDTHLRMEGAYSILVLTTKTGQSSTAATALDSPEGRFGYWESGFVFR